jgi:membrane associated rhomboid family serine protease
MDKLLARLERSLGRFAVPNLTWVIVAGMAVVYVLQMLRPGFSNLLVFDLESVKHGQVWRLFSYIFVPPQSMLFAFLRIWFVWWVGAQLEAQWGAFKYDLYWLIGIVGTTSAAAFTGMDTATSSYLTDTLFLAYATMFPDETILLIILPVRAKWLGWLSGALLGYLFVTGSWADRAGIIAATGNYLLFFSGHWIGWFKSRRLQNRQRARRVSMTEPAKPKTSGRTCAICGASEDDGADIRVCSCEKCGGVPRTLCLPHARNH